MPTAFRPVTIRSIAGSVAPIAIVAGASARKEMPKEAAHWRSAPGSAPMTPAAVATTRGSSADRATDQTPMTTSIHAYQRTGSRLRRTGPSRAHDPSAHPQKNAATTASTALIS